MNFVPEIAVRESSEASPRTCSPIGSPSLTHDDLAPLITMNGKILTALGGALLLAGPALLSSSPATAFVGEPPTIFSIVENSDDFDTLEVALEATGLDAALDGTTRFTVFAPTDAAFDLLGMETINALLNDLPTLTKILEYHVVTGDVPSSQVIASSFLTTLADQRVDVTLENGNAFVDTVLISQLDIPAANGIVHVIDAVLQPNTLNILDTAADVGGFTTLATAVNAASLDGALNAMGPFTVFAPNDFAFGLLPTSGLNSLVTNQIPLLTLVLQYHVVPGRLYADEVTQLTELTTLLGAKLQVRQVNGDWFVNGSRLILTDVEAVNGNIHVIDRVLAGERIF